MRYELDEVLIRKEDIEARVAELGRAISEEYRGRKLLMVGILRGAFIFMSDLARQVDGDVDLDVDFMAVSSYGDATRSSGVVRIIKDVSDSLEGKDVLIVEDIVDTGLTLAHLKGYLLQKGARSVAVCALLDKSERRVCEVDVEYSGFSIPNKFVVGYGLDCGEKWRHLPEVYSVAVFD